MTRPTATIAALTVAWLAGSWSLVAQSAPNDVLTPAFEVASVKLNKSGEDRMRMGLGSNRRFQATDASLRELIENSYSLRSFQLIGGPPWLDSDRFDVIATVSHDPAPSLDGPSPELLHMIRNLLADRFKLRAHTESRDAPIYALVRARADGKLGSRMRNAEFDCAALILKGGPAPAVTPGQLPPCGTRSSQGKLTVRGGTMAQIARTIAGVVEKIVVNKTELSGGYDLDLEWTTDATQDASNPSFFTALQEQLGLKLESTRGPVEVLVIDHAEAPTQD